MLLWWNFLNKRRSTIRIHSLSSLHTFIPVHESTNLFLTATFVVFPLFFHCIYFTSISFSCSLSLRILSLSHFLKTSLVLNHFIFGLLFFLHQVWVLVDWFGTSLTLLSGMVQVYGASLLLVISSLATMRNAWWSIPLTHLNFTCTVPIYLIYRKYLTNY